MVCSEQLKKIDEIINRFVSQFGCRAVHGREFCYYQDADTEADTVMYELDFGRCDKNNRDFMASVKRQNPRIKLNVFVWSLLHEVGHHMNDDEFDEEELDRIYKKKARIFKNGHTRPYFYLPDEVCATKWAVDYANSHREEVLAFWNELYAAVTELFKVLRPTA